MKTENTEAEAAEQQMIAGLKAKYGKITTVEIPLDEDDATKKLVFYLRKPDKQTRSLISKLANGAVPEKAIVAGYNALRVAGDDASALQNNDDALISAEEALIEILKVQKATIKKN